MSDNQRQPIHAGGVRIIVRLGHRQAAGDFMAQVLPEWLFENLRLCSQAERADLF
jgi:hypothetical protein